MKNLNDAASRPDVPRSLRRSVSWSVAGTLSHAFVQWSSLFLIARLTTPEELGTVALGLAITTPVFNLANLQLRTLRASDATGLYSGRAIWAVRLVLLVVAIGVIGAISATVGRDDRVLVWVLTWLCIGGACDSISDVIYAELHRKERLDIIARSTIARAVLLGTLLPLLLWTYEDVRIATAAFATSSLVPLLILDLKYAPKFWKLGPCDANLVGKMLTVLRDALPLGISSMLLAFNTSLPRIIVEAALDRPSLGLLALITQVVGGGNLVIASVIHAYSPRLANAARTGMSMQVRSLMTHLYVLTACVGGLGILGAATIGEPTLRSLFSISVDFDSVLLISLAAGGSLYFFSSVTRAGLIAYNIHYSALVAVLSGVVVNGVICWVLVRSQGLIGCALGIASGNAVQLVTLRALFRLRCR